MRTILINENTVPKIMDSESIRGYDHNEMREFLDKDYYFVENLTDRETGDVVSHWACVPAHTLVSEFNFDEKLAGDGTDWFDIAHKEH